VKEIIFFHSSARRDSTTDRQELTRQAVGEMCTSLCSGR
jgi:hypothetical protein